MCAVLAHVRSFCLIIHYDTVQGYFLIATGLCWSTSWRERSRDEDQANDGCGNASFIFTDSIILFSGYVYVAWESQLGVINYEPTGHSIKKCYSIINWHSLKKNADPNVLTVGAMGELMDLIGAIKSSWWRRKLAWKRPTAELEIDTNRTTRRIRPRLRHMNVCVRLKAMVFSVAIFRGIRKTSRDLYQMSLPLEPTAENKVI